MIRNIFKTGFAIKLLPTDIVDADKLSNLTPTEKTADKSIVHNETGWDRVKRIFEVDDFGAYSREMQTVLHVGAMSLFVGACYGGFVNSREAYMDFIKNNQATIFHDHLEAKAGLVLKRLQDHVTKSFGRGAWKWSWRLSLFCTSFAGISTVISVYRGKSGIVEYVAAGLVSGTLYKFNMGPRGWLVGGGLGSVLGLVAGCTTLGLLKLTGISMDEVRYWNHHWQQSRQDYIHEGMKEYVTKEEERLVHFHNQKIGEDGKSLDKIE